MNMKAIIDELIDNGYELTENPMEAIYIFEDGTMIDGIFDCGLRSEDHRMIECLMESDRYDNNFWDDVHSQLKVVRLVPETKFALIAENQILSPIQESIINEYGYEVEVY